MMLKTCRACKIEKTTLDFYPGRARCKSCYIAAQRTYSRVGPTSKVPGPFTKEPRSTTYDVHHAVQALAKQPVIEVLTGALEWMTAQNWNTRDRPDVFSCLVVSLGSNLIQTMSYTGENRSVARGRLTQLFTDVVTSNKSARNNLVKITGYLGEAAGWGDLEYWSQEISLGSCDVIDLFERAAKLAESKGD